MSKEKWYKLELEKRDFEFSPNGYTKLLNAVKAQNNKNLLSFNLVDGIIKTQVKTSKKEIQKKTLSIGDYIFLSTKGGLVFANKEELNKEELKKL